MLSIFSDLRELTLLSVAVRMILAIICGGIIGIERAIRRRPAGFRTHILICLGAAIVTLTSQYLYLHRGYAIDLGRLGAQVIAGVGFIGAGTIIVTHRQRVKGLTTAAGLWTNAIVGLALGAGFYEGAILVAIFVFVAEMLLAKAENQILRNSPEVNLYMEYTGRKCLEKVLQLYREIDVKILNMEITRSKGSKKHNACVIFMLRLNKKCNIEKLFAELHLIEGVLEIEEI